MRTLFTLASILALTLVAPVSWADKPEPARAFAAGALVFVAGFTAGAVLLGTSKDNNAQNNAGWLSIEGAFAAAPFVAHAASGEWTRALVFSAPPAAMLGATATLLAADPSAIGHGPLDEQRVLWALFGVGLFSSVVGVIDSTFAEKRARMIAAAPMFGSGQVGVRIGVTL